MPTTKRSEREPLSMEALLTMEAEHQEAARQLKAKGDALMNTRVDEIIDLLKMNRERITGLALVVTTDGSRAGAILDPKAQCEDNAVTDGAAYFSANGEVAFRQLYVEAAINQRTMEKRLGLLDNGMESLANLLG